MGTSYCRGGILVILLVASAVTLTAILLRRNATAFPATNVSDTVNNGTITRIVHTLSGPVRGFLERSHFEARDYFAYRGIPYARPPTGELRFRAPRPLPANAWPALDARSSGAPCMQETAAGTIIGAEDCLTLNVYSPQSAALRRLPVLVFVHGGAFSYRPGAPDDLFGPDVWMERGGVVLLTFNFRLGVLGFLATAEATAPHANNGTEAGLWGNWGLLDQRLVLRWVRDNIGAFGGDPQRVTLAGHGSGALAVQMHRQASGSLGLFGRTIEMSTAFGWRAVFRQRSGTDSHDELRQLAGLPVNSSDAQLVSALRYLPAEWLVRYAARLSEGVVTPRADRFCDRSIHATSATGIDVLTGCTSNEAILQITPDGGRFEQFQRDHRIEIPSVRFTGDYDSPVYLAAQERIFRVYFPAGVANATLAQYVRLQSDAYQTVPLDRKVRELAARRNAGRTYQYEFGLDTRLNGWKRWQIGGTIVGSLEGASHADELCYLFDCGGVWPRMYDTLNVASPEYELVRRVSRVFVRFVEGSQMDWEPAAVGETTGYMRMWSSNWTEARRKGGVLGVRKRALWDGVMRAFGDRQRWSGNMENNFDS